MTGLSDPRPVLITGGAGFVGSNLADRLASEGHEVIVYDSLARPGVETNLAWLIDRHGPRIRPVQADIRDAATLTEAARQAKAVFHLAAQVAVTTSLVHPLDDFSVNVQATVQLLEAIRLDNPRAPVIFASTNKVYGNLSDVPLALGENGYRPATLAIARHGIDEKRPLDFHTPYGCSKGAADQYVLDYARSFGLRAAVLRMSCIYGRRQMGTEDQGWVAHFLISALNGRPITLFGDGHQVRDILDVRDAVDAYVGLWGAIDRWSGRAFNLGGGPDNAVSLNQLLTYMSELLGRPVLIGQGGWRAGDQRYFVSDRRAIAAALDLAEPIPWRAGVRDLAAWLEDQGVGEARSAPHYAQAAT